MTEGPCPPRGGTRLHADRPHTGNWRYEDFHPARFTALSPAPPEARQSVSEVRTSQLMVMRAQNFPSYIEWSSIELTSDL